MLEVKDILLVKNLKKCQKKFGKSSKYLKLFIIFTGFKVFHSFSKILLNSFQVLINRA